MAIELPGRFTGTRIPEMDGVVVATGYGEKPPVRRESDMDRRMSERQWRDQRLAGHRIPAQDTPILVGGGCE
jgi:hypothetical protein